MKKPSVNYRPNADSLCEFIISTDVIVQQSQRLLTPALAVVRLIPIKQI